VALAVWLCAGAAAGESVKRPAFITVSPLLYVAFTSPSHGIGLFVRTPVPQRAPWTASCTFFTRSTADGGASFGTPGKAVARTNCENGYVVDTVAVDGAGDVFVYGASGVFASRNAGAAWQQMPSSGRIVALAPVGRTIWALSESSCPAPAKAMTGTCTLTLLEPANSGRSWQAAPDQPPDRRVSATGAAPQLSTSLAATGATVDIVLLTNPDSSSVTVEQTIDGGSKWTTERAPCVPGPSSFAFSIAPDGTQWLVCGSQPGASLQPKSIARSLNDGKDWQRSGPLCQIATTCRQDMPMNGYLGGLAAVSATTAFYVGERSSLTATYDGGRSWCVEPGFSGDGSGSAEVTFVNRRDGWAIDEGYGGHAVLWTTRDGGNQWTKLEGTR
jgi:hypothetical protein